MANASVHAPWSDDAWWAAQTTSDGPQAGKAWWGWGLVSELRREVELRLLEEIISKDQRIIVPPTVAEAAKRLPTPRLTLDSFPAALRRICTDAPFERLLHSRGRDMVDILRNLNGNTIAAHDLVAYPENEEDVAALLAECQTRCIAVVPFGGGSSVVQGIEPPPNVASYAGCVAVDLAKMDQVLELDEESQCARVQAGVYGPALESTLKRSSLTMRYFPQSFEYSTLGGWIATRGGGHYATGPTHVEEMVQSLRMVCPAGTTTTRQLPASGAGPAENRLYAGSEGSLGIITEAWVRLRRRPEARANATVVFMGSTADLAFEHGARAVREMAQTGVQPTNLRLVYGPEIVRAGIGLEEAHRKTLNEAAVLLIGFEAPLADQYSCASLDAQMELLLGITQSRASGGLVVAKHLASNVTKKKEQHSGGERDGIAGSWGKGFMRGGYMFSASCLVPSVLVNTCETACTWAAFPALHKAVLETGRAAVRQECGLEGSVTCRFTHIYPDGPAPYYTFVVQGLADHGPSMQGDEDPRIRMWLAIKQAVMDAIIANGGTSTHHHAVGRLHQRHYEMERGALCGATLRAAKLAHDPHSIMSPGMLVGTTPLAKL